MHSESPISTGAETAAPTTARTEAAQVAGSKPPAEEPSPHMPVHVPALRPRAPTLPSAQPPSVAKPQSNAGAAAVGTTIAARPLHPAWLGPHAKNQHIDPRDDIGMETPQLYHLEEDPGETTDVAAAHPDIVKRLLAEAEKAREDIGDHDRVGKNMRFFDPLKERPTTPPMAAAKRKQRQNK